MKIKFGNASVKWSSIDIWEALIFQTRLALACVQEASINVFH